MVETSESWASVPSSSGLGSRNRTCTFVICSTSVLLASSVTARGVRFDAETLSRGGRRGELQRDQKLQHLGFTHFSFLGLLSVFLRDSASPRQNRRPHTATRAFSMV